MVTVDAGAYLKPYSVATDSKVGEGAQVGPFSHLRPGSELGPESHVGNFVETKKTKLGRGAKAALLAGARALLFPSVDEGYGFPPLEALALGTPAVCAPLEVFRETLGDVPVYAEADDMYQWLSIVRALAGGDRSAGADIARRARDLVLPTWSDHVNRVLTTIP